ncbi:MAG TPA: hypothetical protein VIM84_04075, partial [Gemmatimonadales bacterium]
MGAREVEFVSAEVFGGFLVRQEGGMIRGGAAHGVLSGRVLPVADAFVWVRGTGRRRKPVPAPCSGGGGHRG